MKRSSSLPRPALAVGAKRKRAPRSRKQNIEDLFIHAAGKPLSAMTTPFSTGAADAEDIRDALAEPGRSISLEELKKELGHRSRPTGHSEKSSCT